MNIVDWHRTQTHNNKMYRYELMNSENAIRILERIRDVRMTQRHQNIRNALRRFERAHRKFTIIETRQVFACRNKSR